MATLSEVKEQERVQREQAQLLKSARFRQWSLGDLQVDIALNEDDEIIVSVSPIVGAAGVVGKDPLRWLSSEQLKRVAICREPFEDWIAGGNAPPINPPQRAIKDT